jgi:hypothetical protein
MGAPKKAVTDLRRHYCPICPPSDRGTLNRLEAVMHMPGKRMEYHCDKGHRVSKKETILQ